MGTISKGLLLFNTVRYLKPRQVLNQIVVRIKPKEGFWEYRKQIIDYTLVSLWIDGLDNDPVVMDRFKPDGVLNGRLTLLNETRFFDKWNYPDASHLWNFNVHYLEFLVPLYSLWKTTKSDEYKKKINDILGDWYESGSKDTDSNQSYTISLRIVNQLIIADAISDKKAFLDSIYSQYRYLLKHQEKHLLGNHYLENLKAIVIGSVVFKEDDIYKKYIKRFLDELKEQITEDGLHYELSLMYHKIILEDLIRVAVALKQAEKREYKDVVCYIARMVTALYSLEADIDRTLLFNDSGDNVAKTTESLIAVCRKLFGVMPENKDHIAGYYKLCDGKTTAIVDCGDIATLYMPGHAHCDCLSFEMFYDGKPVFVNSGTYQYQSDLRIYFRSTAAHNSVVINGHEQSELWGEHRVARRMNHICSKKELNKIVGTYRNYLGETHKRKIVLADGVMTVVDRTSETAQSFLHLAPGFHYEDGKIQGDTLNLEIEPINAVVEKKNTPYSDSFGKIENIESLIFEWKKDNEEHGYKICFKEKKK